MKLVHIILLLFLSIPILIAANPTYINHGERYFSFQINDRSEIQKLTRMISIDNVQGKTVYAYANQKEWDEFNKLQYTITPLFHPGTLIDIVPSNDRDIWAFDTYPSYTQYETMMTTFASTYPNLCQIYTLGTLASGRKILFAHISSNVATPAAKPEVEYTSTMHGDETTGYVTMLHLINELLSKYGTDTRITNMVNNLDIWINPCANPDGTYAGGNASVSGATRGNHNGVDFNRDFRDPILGYFTNQELETTLFEAFADTHHFVQVANFHGGAEVVNYPWDDWTSSTYTHPDAAWFITESKAYADTAKAVSSFYLTSVTASGYTEGGDWYTINGGRQDYTNYFSHGREVTIELSNTKMPAASTMLTYWNYNYKSLFKYLERPYYAIRGTVTNSLGIGVAATVTVNSHDAMNSEMITDPAFGDYYRMIAPGTWSLTFSADGYRSQTINNVVVVAGAPTVLNIVMQSIVESPTNLQAVAGNASVRLTWTAPTGTPDGYKVYRNSILITPIPISVPTYTDNTVTNGTLYTYYVTSIYTSPAGESSPSGNATATPYAAPPSGLTALAKNGAVTLTWIAPVTGTPSSYKIYRGGVAVVSNISSLTYTNSGLSNGSNYSFYVTAVYTIPIGSESSGSNTVNSTPIAAPPTALTSVAGNNQVSLSWIAPINESPGGYNIFRNSVKINETPITITSYIDTSVINGINYSYYITSVFTTPAAESAASNSVNATPYATTVITIGTGTNTQAYPMDRNYIYSAYESIYLQSEIGTTGTLSKIGFYKSSGTDVNAITNVTIYMMHTAASTLATGNYSTAGYTQVYSGNYTNDGTAGWMEVTLTNPFVYNNTSNLQVLIMKGNQTNTSNYPLWRYTSTSTNYRTRFNHSNSSAPTSLSRSYYRANIRFTIILPVPNPVYVNNQTSFDFGTVTTGQDSVRSFTISNSGGGTLFGSITTPPGYTVAQAARINTSDERNTMTYSVIAGSPVTFNVTFAPTLSQIYSGNISITSNDSSHSSNIISVIGVGRTERPTGVTIITNSGNSTLTWNSVPYATTYHVYRSSTPNGTYNRIDTVYTNSYEITDTTRIYFYYITAE